MSSKPFIGTFVTLFPEFCAELASISVTRRAVDAKLLAIQTEQIRSHAYDKHKTVDDTPYGGGPGQLMKVDVVSRAINAARLQSGYQRQKQRIILLDPKGTIFTSAKARELANYDELIFVCGRYEGIDARIEHYVDESICLGDFVLTGGELAAMTIFDATSRFVPQVLGNSESLINESFSSGMLEYQQYTRPPIFEGHQVPPVLLSGNHALIEQHRRQEQEDLTAQRRPDIKQR